MIAAIPFPALSPEIFSIDIGPIQFALRWYALAYIAGIVIGWMLIARALRRPELWPMDKAPMSKEQLDDLLTWAIIGIILGGRLGYVLFYRPDYYVQNPGEILKIWEGGMAFHGGFLGVVVAAAIWARRNGVPMLQLADALALAAPAGLLLGRISNFINAELWGRPTDAPWGVIFPGEAAQFCPGVEGLCARHPSQLYEAGLEGLLLGGALIFLIFFRNWLKRPGASLGLFLAGYGAARMFVEIFRQADAQFIAAGNPRGVVFGPVDYGLSMGQLLSLPMLLLGLFFLVRAFRRPANPS